VSGLRLVAGLGPSAPSSPRRPPGRALASSLIEAISPSATSASYSAWSDSASMNSSSVSPLVVDDAQDRLAVHLDLDARGELDAGGLGQVLAVVLDERAVQAALQQHLDAGEHRPAFASCSAFMRRRGDASSRT
jgi:hypothetical protein